MDSIANLSNPLWKSMCMFAFAFLVFSWVQSHKGKISVFDSTRYIIFLMAVLVTISFSKDLFFSGTLLINNEAEKSASAIETFLDNAGRVGVEGEHDTFAVAAPLTGVVLDFAHYLAAMIREFFGYFQWGIIFLLYSVSPLMLAFLAHPSTQNIGVRFLTTSFGVMMWKYGFVFADLIFIGSFNEIVGAYVNNTNDLLLAEFTLGPVSINALSISIAIWLIIMLFILVILYFLAPLLVYLIFSGASPAGAVGAAVGSAIGGAAAFSRLSSTLASSRKALGSNMGGKGGGGSAPSMSPLGGFSSLASGAASTPMMGLGAGEVNQREQQRQS